MSALWSLGCLAALSGPVRRRASYPGLSARVGGAGLCGSAWLAARWRRRSRPTSRVYRHDAHLDLTREEAFTPSREASDIVRSLTEPVQVVYFFQKENAAGRGAATMLDLLARLNPRLAVETVDIDRNPARASAFGVQLYNTAVIVDVEPSPAGPDHR